jgi:hypothetical protein
MEINQIMKIEFIFIAVLQHDNFSGISLLRTTSVLSMQNWEWITTYWLEPAIAGFRHKNYRN